MEPKGDLLERGVDALTDRWWVLVVRGVVAIAFGALTFAAPRSSLLALVILWGAYALVDGLFALMLASWRGRAGLRWGWWALQGIVGIAAGIAAFAWPRAIGAVLLTVVGAWAIVEGVSAIAEAVRLRRAVEGDWLLAAVGVLSVAFGVLVLAYPRSGALAIVWTIGAYAIIAGALLVGFGLRLFAARRDVTHTVGSRTASV
jgi:uncharacterized membrane protein HdeD (DUF308 family)